MQVLSKKNVTFITVSSPIFIDFCENLREAHVLRCVMFEKFHELRWNWLIQETMRQCSSSSVMIGFHAVQNTNQSARPKNE